MVVREYFRFDVVNTTDTIVQIIYKGIYLILLFSHGISKLVELIFNEITNDIFTARMLASVYLLWQGRNRTRWYLLTVWKKRARTSTGHPPTMEGNIRVRNGCEDTAWTKESDYTFATSIQMSRQFALTLSISLYLMTRYTLFSQKARDKRMIKVVDLQTRLWLAAGYSEMEDRILPFLSRLFSVEKRLYILIELFPVQGIRNY